MPTGPASSSTSTSTSISTSAAKLRATFNGRVTLPGDDGYDDAREVFYGKFDARPAAIVRPGSAAEVAQVVALARDTGAELAVRSGGHSVSGHSTTEGGILLDLASLRALDVDVAARTAWAQTGLTAGDYTTAAGAHGLATGFGDTATVGLGGLTLGGGVGFLVRKHGLTIDDLLAVEVVTADGQVLVADETNHPDLFWALRGGGGNFGVATRFKYRLHEVGTILGGMLMLPATPEVIADLVAAAADAPEELTVIANVMLAPPMPFIPAEQHGKPTIMALVAYAGPAEDGERALRPIRGLATPLADMVRPMPYPEIYTLFGEGEEMKIQQESSQTFFLDQVDRDAAATVIEHLQASTAPMAVTQLRVLGGAMARVPADATAFAHRDRLIMVSLGCVYERAEDVPEHDAWAARYAAALGDGDASGYVNFIADPDHVRDAYPGGTWDRLAAVKRRYDPANFFHRNLNVPPAANGRGQ